MYSTCLFCNKPLGNNEVLEDFPVGRRVAFDAANGRLWVVCRSCERWNLSPLEDRWEIIESCERLFADERKRVSTENIGLAKLNEGLELVRIGKPQRPEFAAWRYGDQFGRRRKKQMLMAGLGFAALGAVYIGGAAAGAGLYMFNWGGGGLINRIVKGSPNTIIARGEAKRPEAGWGRQIEVKRKHLKHLKVRRDEGDQYLLEIKRREGLYQFRGAEAQRVLSQVLPAVNRYGAPQKDVSRAVSLVETYPQMNAFVSEVATRSEKLEQLPRHTRLALEMAVHEDAERRALEGELKQLEAAWREAEEIAAISDSLLTPNFIQDALERLRNR